MIYLQNKTINDISDDISHLESKIDSYIDTLNKIRWSQYFSMIAEIASGIRDHHKSMTNEIMRLISHTVKGEISRLIPIDKLHQNLNDIYSKIHDNSRLPIDLVHNESDYNIFKLSQIKSALINDRIIVEMRIPILNSQEYTMIRAIPIPIPIHQNNKTILIKPDHEIFLTDNSRTSFIPFNEKEYANCITTTKKSLICSHSAPKYSIYQTCVMNILRNGNNVEIPNVCSFNTIPSQNYIIQLPFINKYYIFVQEPMRIQEICDKNAFLLDTSGFLQIEPSCYVYNEQFSIHGKLLETTDAGVIIAPHMNSSINVNYNVQMPNNSNNHRFIHGNSDEYGKLINKLHQETDISNQIVIPEDSNITFGFMLTTIFIMFIFAIYILRKKCFDYHQQYFIEPFFRSNFIAIIIEILCHTYFINFTTFPQ